MTRPRSTRSAAVGRTAFQREADGLQNARQRFLQRFAISSERHGQGFGQAGTQVAAFDIHGQFLFQRKRGADAYLDFFR